jgi:hypothetical protein
VTDADLERSENPHELWRAYSRVKRERNALLAACREMLPYVDGAYECAFPNESENESVAASARAAIALTEETTK